MAKMKEKEPDRILMPGKPDYDRVDNKVVSARYTLLSFVPLAVVQQFRRFANLYFLIVGVIMAIGWYSDAFESALTPWTTLGPLGLVIAFSLMVEGSSDYKRHVNDSITNNTPCVILRRSDELDSDETAVRDDKVINGRDVVVNINKAYYETTSGPKGHKSTHKSSTEEGALNVSVGFERVRRMDIRQGHFVLVKNREMAPADMVLFASSNDQGSAYIETSSIDGETNLKLRNMPRVPEDIMRKLKAGDESKSAESKVMASGNDTVETKPANAEEGMNFETIDEAVSRITRLSYLGRPEGESALDHPTYGNVCPVEDSERTSGIAAPRIRRASTALAKSVKTIGKDTQRMLSVSVALPKYAPRKLSAVNDGRYICALTTEPPNPSVHTFQGKLTLPPFDRGGETMDIPLGAENVILRGAVIRNTEWVIGIAFFTGTDTKLVQNSFETPSKFSQLDILMNYTVAAILLVMIVCVSSLSTAATVKTTNQFDDLFYVGFNKNITQPWPYLPDLDPPDWKTKQPNWVQYFFLYVTLLNQFIPLSLYITVEIVTFVMLWFVNVDLDMYDDTTNTRAVARSTTVTDLGRIQYVFSDKTGTLTQNVMTFRRCSVDGIAYGAPIQKARPGEAEVKQDDTPYLPIRHLLVGQFIGTHSNNDGQKSRGSGEGMEYETSETLTFNAEMFLRIMCLCHTVVVEKDIDRKDYISSASSVTSNVGSGSKGSSGKGMFSRRGRNSATSSRNGSSKPIGKPSKDKRFSAVVENYGEDNEIALSVQSLGSGDVPSHGFSKAPDGAPLGYAYQAESPDEGALVSAASLTFGFQVVSRNSKGINLRVSKPSHFQNPELVQGLKSGNLTLKTIAAETASAKSVDDVHLDSYPDPSLNWKQRSESWAVLAVNKFDSTRKRMSILLRSPEELGSLPVLFCKGADSAMLDPDVCRGTTLLPEKGARDSAKSSAVREVSALSTVSEDDVDDDGETEDEWEIAQMLGIQAHLGDFASEGLRTLVLGFRVLTESECEEWLEQYYAATTAMEDREKLITEAAIAIERDLHIAGATAIEDKLQVGVPHTISTLGKAGIKLWVLTGDKRETAVEIGYSTAVLTPKMSVMEVGDLGKHYVRTQMAMEFIRLVKKGKLSQYQKAVVGQTPSTSWKERSAQFAFQIGKCWRFVGRLMSRFLAWWLFLCCMNDTSVRLRVNVAEKAKKESEIVTDSERRRKVRERADKMIELWLESAESKKYRRPKPQNSEVDDGEDFTLINDDTPKVFNRAASARLLLGDMRMSGSLTHADLRRISLQHRSAQERSNREADVIVDADALSLESFLPEGDKDDVAGHFDKTKRTALERLFAIDRQVRKGQLKKHVNADKLAALEAVNHASTQSFYNPKMRDGPRALVIEGAALKHLLGDKELEEILFAVASVCDSVIACRVSPKQKAELVNLVRHNVKPTPTTLAIGDGANDVGMIQEAHVGVGISGKEGTQAVNASDFSISQFRFLETLILIHGRWDFFRLGTVVLYSFYKNAVQAGIMIVFNFRTVFSGQPYFDQWLIASLNFVCGAPIIVTGLFDRCLSKDYVRANPEVYKASRENELITVRTCFRWVFITVSHISILYFFTAPASSTGGGMTSAFKGLMYNEPDDEPGNGEGGDWRSVGTVTFTCLVITLAYKLLYESRSLVHGRWPSIRCSKKFDSFVNRLAYTWQSITWLSIGFYFVFISGYQLAGRIGPNPSLGGFVDMANHVLATRSINWMLFAFVPLFAIAFDVTFKVFSNIFYPTQTQIHMEIEAMGKRVLKRARRAAAQKERLGDEDMVEVPSSDDE
ncbi:hypothetical protein ACA910_009683 [Epithemia clementina (nom. ined.)]